MLTDSEQKASEASSVPTCPENIQGRWESEPPPLAVSHREMGDEGMIWGDDTSRTKQMDTDDVSTQSLTDSRQESEEVPSAAPVHPEGIEAAGAGAPHLVNAGAPHLVNQSLERLEMNSLQVKLYLDSIDQRISRMEPRLEGIRSPEPAPSPAEVPLEASEEKAPLADVAPVLSTTERRRRAQGVPIERRRAPRTVPVVTEEGERWALKPWLVAHRMWAPALMLGVIAVIGLAYWIAGQHATPKGRFGTTAAGSMAARAGSNGAAKSSADTGWSAGVGQGTGNGEHSSGSNHAREPRSGTTTTEQGVAVPMTSGVAAAAPVSSSTAASVPAAPSSTATEMPGVEKAETSGAGSEASEPEPPAADPRSTRPGSADPSKITPSSATRVHVSSGVMAGNLIYSRPPTYPKGLAGLFHTQGQVVLQAIISKNGRVQNLRVISGHYMLRGAAKDAVRTWRYRPYSIHGVPVEVATIISVEFHR